MANPEYIKKQKTPEQFMGHVCEEAGEVVTAIGKIIRFGPLSYNPTLPPEEQETNRAWLLRELIDLQGAVERYLEKGYTENEVRAEREKRVAKIEGTKHVLTLGDWHDDPTLDVRYGILHAQGHGAVVGRLVVGHHSVSFESRVPEFNNETDLTMDKLREELLKSQGITIVGGSPFR